MDISKTIEPKSDQLNADDMLTGSLTITVDHVAEGTPEQPVHIHSREFPGRPYKPSKGMRRVLAAAWGTNTDTWPKDGRIQLRREASVKYAGKEVGGIWIEGLSHIDQKLTLAVRLTRGKSAPITIHPIMPAVTLTDEEITTCTSLERLRAMWQHATREQQDLINQRAAQLQESETK